MYKAVNLSEKTYQELHKIATQLHKPKAQVIESLVKDYAHSIKEQQKRKLNTFNTEMGAKIKALKFSKKIKFDSNTIDADFAALADTDYIK